MPNTTSYLVEGMTCGHCVTAVTEELQTLECVSDVTVDLNTTGASTVRVTSEMPLSPAQLPAAVVEAGDYRLVGTTA